MLGGSGLQGRGIMPAISRQRLTASSRSSRSMSSFRPPISGFPVRYGRPNQSVMGSRSWKPASPTLSTIANARFNSTSSTTLLAGQAADAAPPANASGIPDLSVTDINAIPENIGYLKELGLDYGWGPSSLVEFIIEHFHIWGGLPWWASIIGTGILIRLALLKPMLGAADTATRLNNIKPLLDPLRAKMGRLMQEGKREELVQTRAELSALQKAHGVKPYKAFLPMLQIPFGFGCYRVVKGMTSLPVPGLAMESVGWLKDLTIADPYFVLPACSALFLYLSLRKGGETGTNQFRDSSFGKMVLFGFPAISFTFMSFFPSALQLYFVATGFVGLTQAYVLGSHSFRNFAGIALPQRVLSPEQAAAQQRKTIRLLADSSEAPAKATNQAPKAVAPSWIDRTAQSAVKFQKEVVTEVTEKLNQARGKAPATNADGSPIQGPRLSEKDRKLASDYEQRRREEDEWKREERNHARREAHAKALEAERERARLAFRDAQKKASTNQR
ncbi:hypothetical protein EYZ11_008886 [Aspergillus tanneri]|uniref:Mitochondrial inner membrane protein oxa1 n=1 Tax=Aspergillus tanneri TaxID=1220188 RepID=A0A4S3JBF8_9EURO|nr:Mitochondrial inner membrane protein oxa1 [Aspergillus tanneri]KAA8643073.1 Mitochondrial inner membrane protein oxa1 [Aspergillus tanneri]THC91638.1 hypothetical protein EYZ11_008886 [Aspergillus tanneri]